MVMSTPTTNHAAAFDCIGVACTRRLNEASHGL